MAELDMQVSMNSCWLLM